MTNPYAAPSDSEIVTASALTAEFTWQEVARSFVVWVFVCFVAAVPSFFWGYNIASSPLRVPAMCGGVLAYAIAYTCVDQWKLRHWRNANPNFRLAYRWGFGLRIGASVIFPVGMTVDMFPGLCSISVTAVLLQLVGYANSSDELSTVFSVVLTTVIQGALLNILLWTSILLIYLLIGGLEGWNRSRRGL